MQMGTICQKRLICIHTSPHPKRLHRRLPNTKPEEKFHIHMASILLRTFTFPKGTGIKSYDGFPPCESITRQKCHFIPKGMNRNHAYGKLNCLTKNPVAFRFGCEGFFHSKIPIAESSFLMSLQEFCHERKKTKDDIGEKKDKREKPPLWKRKECYEAKRRKTITVKTVQYRNNATGI